MTVEDDPILRPAQVSRLTGLSITTLWRFRKRGQFPREIKLGEKSIGWLASEVHAWRNARIAEREVA